VNHETRDGHGIEELLGAVTAACGRLRCELAASEYEIHAAVARELEAEGVTAVHEYRLGGKRRVDFFCPGAGGRGVAVEIKKGKVWSRELAAQVERYAADGRVGAVVMVIERNVYDPPAEAAGKPVRYVSLSKAWGIAL
jgi:hypothetical protein